MAGRFRGEQDGKMDDKGRVLIPAPFRKVLAEGATGNQVELILVYGPHLKDHAQGYSAAAFERIEERIDAMPAGTARSVLETSVVGCSRTLAVDESGRIVLPPKVRARCGLPVSPAKGESVPIYLIGQINKFTLWREDVFDVKHADVAAMAARVPEGEDIMKLIEDPNAFALA